MATSVNITLTLDDKGVVSGLRSVGGELDNLKTRAATGAQGASQAMGALDKSTQRSIDSARLLESTFGVALPRTLTKIIGQSAEFGNVLSAAFNVSVVAALGAAVVVVGGKIADAALEWGGYTKSMQEAYAANVKANTEQLANPRTPEIAKRTLEGMEAQRKKNDEIIASQTKENELVQDFFDIGTRSLATAGERVQLEEQLRKTEESRIPLLQKLSELDFAAGTAVSRAQAAAGAAGLQGYAALAQQHKANLDELDRTLASATPMGQGQYDAQVAAENLKYSRLLGALAEQNAETTRKLREQVVQGWLQGDDLILAKEQALEAALKDLGKHTLDDDLDLEQRRVLYREQAEQQILDALRKRLRAEVEITDQFHAQTQEIVDRAQTRELEGYYKLYADEKQQLNKNLQDYKAALDKEQRLAANADELQAARKKLSLDLDQRNAAAKEETATRLQALQAHAALGTQQIEMQAAIATLAPWERADAEIYASAEERVRAINDLAQRGLIFQSDVAGRTAAAWQEAAGKVTDEWSNPFENLFNGGISAQIEQNVKKFAARLAAELTLQSGMGGILAPLLGLPAPGMTGAGYASAMGATNLGFGTMFGGGTASFMGAGATVAAASGMPLLVGGGAGGGLAGGSTNAGGYNVNAINQLLGIPTLSGVPALSGAGSLGRSGGGSLFSMQGMASMLPIAAGFLGCKLGGTPGMIGAGLLGAMGATVAGSYQVGGPMLTLWTKLASVVGPGAATGLLAGAGGGLLGYGIGQQYGTAAGIISGAGSGVGMAALFGALTGSLGPVGLIIGGVLGLLGGLFGGLSGGSARRKAADSFVQQQETAAQQIEAQFKSFQVDYPTALADLEQIRTNASDQLRKLKSEGSKAFSRDLSPYIDKVEGELKGYQDERDRRATLAFAPPQFALGGTVWGYGAGGVHIIAHPGEEVVNPAASARNRPLLKAINSGANVSAGGDVHIHLHIIDGASTMTWLKNGGGDTIANYARGRRLEGRAF